MRRDYTVNLWNSSYMEAGPGLIFKVTLTLTYRLLFMKSLTNNIIEKMKRKNKKKVKYVDHIYNILSEMWAASVCAFQSNLSSQSQRIFEYDKGMSYILHYNATFRILTHHTFPSIILSHASSNLSVYHPIYHSI